MAFPCVLFHSDRAETLGMKGKQNDGLPIFFTLNIIPFICLYKSCIGLDHSVKASIFYESEQTY